MKYSQQTHGWYRYTRGYHLVVIALALLSACFLLFTAVAPASALTTVPTKMNFQGRLTDASGNIKPNGTYNMRLKLYTVNSGGTSVWSEDRLVSATQGVTVTNGLFSIQLGSITTLPASLFASGQLYLEVELPTPATATSASPTWTEGPMTPRNQMATSAYAYNAETLDGLDSASFGQLSTANTWSGTNTFSGSVLAQSSLTLGTTSAQGSLVVHDGNGQTGTIRMADTAGSYIYTIPVTAANDTFCLQTLANCGGGSGVTTVGALDGGTANANGATISGTTMYLQSASASFAGLVNTTTQTFTGNKTFSGTLTVSSAATFSGTLTVGSGGDTVSLSTTGLSLAGTARGTKTVALIPEYQGATFRGDGTNNTGSLSSDFCSSATGGLSINTTVCSAANQEHNYYEWANTQATAQDYDLYVRYQLPADYSTGSMTNLTFTAHGGTTTEAATLTMHYAGTQCATSGDVVTSAGTWQTGTVVLPLGSCTPAANNYVIFKIQLSATQNNQVRAGAIGFTYRSTF